MSMSSERQPRVIKRYANRKLYDMSESCYITHDEIASLVKQGEDVRIIDNRTKEDLTTLTLTQILFKEEKRQRKTLPLSTLRTILQSGGDFFDRHVTQPLDQFRNDAEATVRKVFGKDAEEGFEGEVTPDDEDGPPMAPPVQAPEAVGSAEAPVRPTEATPSAADRRGAEGLREWVDATTRAFESLQKNLEDRWSLVFHSLGQFDANKARIAELEARIQELEATLSERGHGRAQTGEAAGATGSEAKRAVGS